MKKIISLIAISSSFFISAQQAFDHKQLQEDVWFKKNFHLDKNEVEGTPYLKSEFQPAQIESSNEIISARYNMLNDNIEFMKNGEIYILDKNDLTKSIIFPNEKIELINDGYFIKIFDGDVTNLYTKKSSRFQKAVKARSTYAEDKQAKFITQADVYYFKINDKLIEVPKNQNKFASLFPDIQKDVLNIIKQKKLKLDNSKDLILLVKVLDSKLSQQ